MKLDAVHPDFRKATRFFPRMPLNNRLMRAVIRGLSRALPLPKSTSAVEVTEAEANGVPLLVYTPTSGAVGAMLWIHGGGYVMGSHRMNAADCIRYARKLKLVVVSVDYRLAPKTPFPGPLNDCHAAWQWLVNNAKRLNINPNKMLVAGQSAGGGLAAALVQKLCNEDAIKPLGQVLYYPMLDDRTALNNALTEQQHFVWNNENNAVGWAAYLGQPPGGDNTPAYSVPARTPSLASLPPTWLGVGDIDLFYDENLRYAERLQADGVPCTVHIVPGGPHAFDAMAPRSRLTRGFMRSQYQFIRQLLGSDGAQRA